MEEDIRAGISDSGARRMLAAAYDSVPGGDALGADLLRDMRRSPVRRRIPVRAVFAAGSTALVAGGAAAVFAVTAVPAAPPALAASTVVANAAAKTASQSYQYTAVTTGTGLGPGWDCNPCRTSTGVWDPAHSTGRESDTDHTTPGTYQALVTGGKLYDNDETGGPSHWVSQPYQPLQGRQQNRIDRIAALEQVVSGYVLVTGSFIPQELLALVKSGAQFHSAGPASGPGWSGTKYSFLITSKPSDAPYYDNVTGTVGVDSQGRIRTLIMALIPQPDTRADPATTYGLHMTIGDFGVPVSVKAPPASEVTPEPGAPIFSPY